MNAAQKRRQESARQRLQTYCELVREYREQWGLAPDKEVTLNLWAQARSAEKSSAKTDGRQLPAFSTEGE